MLRLHRRHQYIRKIFSQIREIGKRGGPEIHVCVLLDRPSAEVSVALNRQLDQLPNRVTFSVHESPIALMSARDGQRWMKATQLHYLWMLQEIDAQAAMVWDDDLLFTPEGIRELRGHLAELYADRLDVMSVFMWDAANTHNTKFLEHPHWGTILFRVVPGDDFPTNFIVTCTEKVARSPYAERLRWPILNYGLFTQQERDTAWASSRAAGRIDAFTLNFIQPPQLETWQSEDVPQLLSRYSRSSPKRALTSAVK